jgi:signal transduction histidine kinase
MPTLDWSAAERRAIYLRGLGIRAAAATTFLVFFTILRMAGPARGIEGFVEIQAVLAGLLLVNPPLWLMGKAAEFSLNHFYAHWALDLIGVTYIVIGLGIFDIPLSIVAYVIMVISSATFASRRASLMLASAASMCLLVAVGAESVGLIDHRHVSFAYHYEFEGRVFLAGASVVLLLVFGVLAGDLADMMRRKADELAQGREELRVAYDKERSARNNLSVLAMIVQHDVYGPLAIISSASTLLLDEIDQGRWEEARRYSSMINARLRSIESAVTTLGALAKEAVDESAGNGTQSIVGELLDDLGTETKERGATIEIVGNWATVRIGRAELYHVLRNLLSNALKAVPADGTGHIIVASERQADGGCEIAVTDNGSGIDDRLRDKLLTKELESLGSPKPGGGYGMGLTLSRNLVDGWGGTLRLHALEGPGSRFVVIIPPGRVIMFAEE